MTTEKGIETTFAQHLGDLTKLVLQHRTELNKQLEHKEFEKAKVTIDSIQSILEILTRLRTIEIDWKRLQSLTAPVSSDIVKGPKGKRGRQAKPVALEPLTETVELVEPKKRGRKPGQKNVKTDKRKGKRGRKPRNESSSLPHLSQKEYYRPILETLHENGGQLESNRCRDLLRNRLTHVLQPGDFAPVGDTKIERWAYLIPWAKLKLVKAGLMRDDVPRKIWAISDHGKDWLTGKLELTISNIDKLHGVPGVPESDANAEPKRRGRKPKK